MFCEREKVPVSNINQQNDKSTKEYQRTIWIRSHSTIAPMGKSQNHRIFTLRCIGLNIIPVSIRLKPVRSKQNISTSARKIIEKLKNS